MTTEYKKPLPQPTSITKPFWDGTKEHVLRLQKCLTCGQPFYYARNVCPHCLSDQLEWFNASGKGKVYSFTVAHRPTIPAFAERRHFALFGLLPIALSAPSATRTRTSVLWRRRKPQSGAEPSVRSQGSIQSSSCMARLHRARRWCAFIA